MNRRAILLLLVAFSGIALSSCSSPGSSQPQLSTAETCEEIQAVMMKHEFDWVAAEDDLRTLAEQASVATRSGIIAMADSAGYDMDEIRAACPE